MKERISLKTGTVKHGSVYEGPARYQDRRYKERVDKLMAARAKKAKPEVAA